jgi:ketosteroid isomerase-like protein
MSVNTETVEKYIDGFRKTDHEQILACLTDDIKWTVYGAFQLSGKPAYDDAIENDMFVGHPDLEIVRLVEEDDVVMAEMRGGGEMAAGGRWRAAMAEVFVMENGLIKERRAFVVPLTENDFK